MKLNWTTGLILFAVVVVTLRFSTQIRSALSKVPIVSALVG